MKNTMTDRPDHLEEGFSLIEILISMVILALVLISILTLFPQGFSTIRKAGHNSTVTHLAYQKIDDLKLQSTTWTDSDLSAAADDNPHPCGSSGGVPNDCVGAMVGGTDYKGHSITWEVEDDEPRIGMKTVTVTSAYNLRNDSDGTLCDPVRSNRVTKLFQVYLTSNPTPL